MKTYLAKITYEYKGLASTLTSESYNLVEAIDKEEAHEKVKNKLGEPILGTYDIIILNTIK